MDRPPVPLLMSISPAVIVPDADVGDPLVVRLPATSNGNPFVKSTPVKASAYCPPVPLVVSEAEENKIVAAAVPEFAPDQLVAQTAVSRTPVEQSTVFRGKLTVFSGRIE